MEKNVQNAQSARSVFTSLRLPKTRPGRSRHHLPIDVFPRSNHRNSVEAHHRLILFAWLRRDWEHDLSLPEVRLMAETFDPTSDPVQFWAKAWHAMITRAECRYRLPPDEAKDLVGKVAGELLQNEAKWLHLGKEEGKSEADRENMIFDYFFRCLKWRFLDDYRRRKRKRAAAGGSLDWCRDGATEEPLKILIREELREQVRGITGEHLSPDELRLLEFAADGASYKQIADELDISVEDVRNGLARIRRRLKPMVRRLDDEGGCASGLMGRPPWLVAGSDQADGKDSDSESSERSPRKSQTDDASPSDALPPDEPPL